MKKFLVLDLILKFKKGTENSVNKSLIKGKAFLIKINSNKSNAFSGSLAQAFEWHRQYVEKFTYGSTEV